MQMVQALERMHDKITRVEALAKLTRLIEAARAEQAR